MIAKCLGGISQFVDEVIVFDRVLSSSCLLLLRTITVKVPSLISNLQLLDWINCWNLPYSWHHACCARLLDIWYQFSALSVMLYFGSWMVFHRLVCVCVSFWSQNWSYCQKIPLQNYHKTLPVNYQSLDMTSYSDEYGVNSMEVGKMAARFKIVLKMNLLKLFRRKQSLGNKALVLVLLHVCYRVLEKQETRRSHWCH